MVKVTKSTIKFTTQFQITILLYEYTTYSLSFKLEKANIFKIVMLYVVYLSNKLEFA